MRDVVSAHITSGREGLYGLIKTPHRRSNTNGLIVAEGDYVIVHGSGQGLPGNWMAADILRIEDGFAPSIGT